MHNLVEGHITRAITDRFNERLREPARCKKTVDEVVKISLAEYQKNPGYGVSAGVDVGRTGKRVFACQTANRRSPDCTCRDHGT